MAKKYRYAKAEPCVQAIIFARVSTKEQEPGASLKAQREAMEDYCNKIGLPIVQKYKVIESSTNGKRVQFNEMLDFVRKQKRKTAIVVHTLDRLQRGFGECEKIKELLKADKIEVHFIQEALILDKFSSDDDFTRYDFGILSAKLYLTSMNRNVRRSQKHNREAGLWQGLAPIGYLNAKDERKRATLILDPERSPIIKQIFEEYATGLHSGVSLLQLARSMGLVSKQPNYHKESANYQKKSFIHVNTILSMLRNPFYYGMMCIKGKLMPHIHGNIISKDLFDRVQKVLDSKHKEGKQQQLSKYVYIFRSLITCGCCGHKVFSDYSAKRNKYIYLRCYHCKNPSVNENIILQQLEEEVFSKIILSNQEIKHLQDSLNKHFEEKRIRNTELKEAILKIVEILGNLSLFMQQSDNKAKNILLSLLLSNCTLKDKKLTYTLNIPFNYLLTTPNHKEWKDIIIKHLKEFKKMVLMIEKM